MSALPTNVKHFWAKFWFFLILIIVPSIMSCCRDLVYIDGEAIIKRGEDGVEGNDSKKCNRNQASRIREVT